MNDPSRNDPEQLHQAFERVWGNPRGWRALTIVNHTTIGLRFMVTGVVFFIIGGLLALVMRAQLALPGRTLLSHEAYNQAFTMHGTVMMFLFAVPMLEGLAAYLIPKMVGARDLVFPRLSALSYWCYLFGGIILVSSILLGLAPNAGWFLYTPLSSDVYTPGPHSDFWLLGITFLEISAVGAGVELAVTILRTRTTGMALQRMPLFAWYILVTALMIVVGFPPLILGSILLELERTAGFPFFDIVHGGDPVLWQHLFWLFGHPEVYIIFLPSAGIVSTLLPVFARRPMVGYRWVVLAVIITGFISFGLWVHHMFTVGLPHLAEAFFSAASMLVAIPTGIQIFAWLATLWTGRPVFRLPMLWILGFLVVFVAGGLTGVMLALIPFNTQVHDTHFVVAHMHYVLVGGMLFPLMAGLYYWLPHFSGRMPSERLGRWGFWLVFIGFNVAFLVMHWTGLMGMPRRVYTYEAGLGWDLPNLISSVGGFVMAIGLAMTLLDMILHFRFGRPARANPWDGDTLEWATGLPPTAYNFVSLPRCDTRHPLWEHPDLPETIAQGRHTLCAIDHGRRETWGTDPVTGKARHIVQLPGNTWLPLFAGLALAAVCIALLVRVYSLAALAFVVTIVILLRWSWESGARTPGALNPAGADSDLPLHWRTFSGPSRWGMGFTLLANAVLFVSLLFGWFFLKTVAPGWQIPDPPALERLPLLLDGMLLTAATLWFRRVVRGLGKGDDDRLQTKLWGVAAVGGVQVLGLGWLFGNAPLAPAATAHDAVIVVALSYLLLHCVMACVFTVLQALRVRFGYVGRFAPNELSVVGLWWYYTLAAFWIVYVAMVAFPGGWGAA